MTDLIQVRRGTSAEWAAANPVLAVAEPGFDTTTGTFKLGDGITAWSGLAAAGGVSGLQTAFDSRYVAVPTAWAAVAFANSWVDLGAPWQVCQYRKTGDLVQVRGLMMSGTIGLPSFTLPVGFRPPAGMGFAASSNGAFGAITITSAGVFTPVSGSNVAYWVNCEFSVTA